MKYDHRVKIGGVWYKAGEEVPALGTTEPKINTVDTVETEPIVETKATVKKTYQRKK